MEISLRPASENDRAFVAGVYFETQRWIIDQLFGWKGDAVESAAFAKFYDRPNTSIILVDRQDAGWLTVQRADDIHVDGIYLKADHQRQGIGTRLLGDLMAEADNANVPIRIETAKINPARTLYERLGFAIVSEDAYKVYMVRRS